MDKIKKDIAAGSFEPVYLIYGPESFLRREMKKALQTAIAGDDTWNLTYREGRDVSWDEVREIAQTVPFMAERRLILLENTGWAEHGGKEQAEFIPQLPPESIMVLVELSARKDNALFKAIEKAGHVCFCGKRSETDIRRAAAEAFRREGYQITGEALDLFAERCGTELENLVREKEKLLAYAYDSKRIELKDVEAVTVPTLQNRIFSLLEAMASGRPGEAFVLYEELRALRVSSGEILFLMNQHIGRLLACRELMEEGSSAGAAGAALGIHPYAAEKYMRQARAYSFDELLRNWEEGIRLDYEIKTGGMEGFTAVELLLAKMNKA